MKLLMLVEQGCLWSDSALYSYLLCCSNLKTYWPCIFSYGTCCLHKNILCFMGSKIFAVLQLVQPQMLHVGINIYFSCTHFECVIIHIPFSSKELLHSFLSSYAWLACVMVKVRSSSHWFLSHYMRLALWLGCLHARSITSLLSPTVINKIIDQLPPAD